MISSLAFWSGSGAAVLASDDVLDLGVIHLGHVNGLVALSGPFEDLGDLFRAGLAAGLAHETRNPLNIIRGLAHMISKQPDSSPEVCQKSRDIIDETDRVTAQLNEFIDFSRPREVRRSAVALNSAVPDFGSVASIVNRFVSTSSGKWNVMNTSPGRSPRSTRAMT